MRKFAYHLTLKVMLLVGLVLSVVVFTRVVAYGIIPVDANVAMFPGWFPSPLATRDVALTLTAIAAPAMTVYWLAYFMTRRGVRKMFPREAY